MGKVKPIEKNVEKEVKNTDLSKAEEIDMSKTACQLHATSNAKKAQREVRQKVSFIILNLNIQWLHRIRLPKNLSQVS